ncbi:hypothetical protein ACH9L7_05250 [Haloferax sp. S1W]|uniref:hypothetical protein n=1 Tax=Haloferax sp. S1W TaxID=3377110 RepID=UPI0037C78242
MPDEPSPPDSPDDTAETDDQSESTRTESEPVPEESLVDATDETTSSTGASSPSDGPSRFVVSIPGGYRTLAGALGLIGAYHAAMNFDHGNPWRGLIIVLVAVSAWGLWRRLRRVDGIGRAFSNDRASSTVLLCAALAGYGAAAESVLLGVIAAAVILLASWVTSPDGPVLDTTDDS